MENLAVPGIHLEAALTCNLFSELFPGPWFNSDFFLICRVPEASPGGSPVGKSLCKQLCSVLSAMIMLLASCYRSSCVFNIS